MPHVERDALGHAGLCRRGWYDSDFRHGSFGGWLGRWLWPRFEGGLEGRLAAFALACGCRLGPATGATGRARWLGKGSRTAAGLAISGLAEP
ncbi:hypothetical protein IL54_0408 [Sphingobium sp. ba1]|nr:hypothetical protein IL54_0408 [Sphingobium sp. ba1]